MALSGSASGPASPIVVAPLTNGVIYTCTAFATNAIGNSAPSAPSSPFATSQTVPQQPTGVVATPGNASASVAFTSGGDGGDPAHLIFYASCVSSDGGGGLGLWSGQTSPILVGGLTNGKTYTCTIQAHNGLGLSLVSAPSPSFVVSAIPGVPGPPNIGTALPGSESATVSFTPGNQGSAPIVDFTASCSSTNGGVPASTLGTESPILVTGLSNGKTYTCAVSESNSFGDSVLSTRTPPFMVGAIPGVPRTPSAIPGSGAATVKWTAPASNGGAPITGYVITQFLGPTEFAPRTINSPATSAVMGNLQNGKTYTFKIAAKNAIGTGPKSVATVGVLVGTPGPPRTVTAKSGEGRATLTWQVPVSANGGPINAYIITPYQNGVAKPAITVPPLPRSRTILSLQNGKSYTFKVTAKNSFGKGPASAASVAVTIGVPLPPTDVHIAFGPSNSFKVSFSSVDSTVPVTKYTATCVSSNGGVTQVKSSGATLIKFGAPTRHRTYTCTVTATNARGTSKSSAKSNSLTVT